MNRSQKITLVVSGLAIAGMVALAAPPVIAATSWAAKRLASASAPVAEPVVEPAAEPDAEADELPADLPDGYVSVGEGTYIPKDSIAGCEDPRWIHLGGGSARLSGDLVDRGSRDLAAGTAGHDDEGRVVTYTVAPGDALYAIGDRFCIANALTIATLNHTRTIQPGEVLLLAPDSSLPWVEYFNPRSAEDGYQQIPYQVAVEKMSAAAWAGDLELMRAIFADELQPLFPDASEADPIVAALEAGDLDALRQMFA